MLVNHSSAQLCLIPNLPEQIQHMVRDISHSAVVPLNMCLVVMASVCNGLLIITVVRTKALHRPSLLMLCNLAVSDFLFASIVLWRHIRIMAHKKKCPNRSSDELTALGSLCLLAILGNLAIISRDRYLAVKKPIWYRIHVTKSRVMRMAGVTWLVSAVITVIFYSSNKFDQRFASLVKILSYSFYLVCTSVIIASYLGLCCKKTRLEEQLTLRAIYEREKRMANTVALILVMLLVTFLPGMLCSLFLRISGVNRGPFRPFYGFLLSLNLFSNPILNFARNKDMRRALRKMIKCSHRVRPSTTF